MIASRTVEYAFLAIGYYAKHKDKKAVKSKDIAKVYGLKTHLYFFKVMQYLVKADILRSQRGPTGGYTLTKSLDKISMLEVIEAVEGPLENRLSLTEHAPKDKFCKKADQVYEKAIGEARKVFKNTKLSDLL